MEEKYSTEWWLWQMYRQVAQYVNNPDAITEAQLRSLIDQYREFTRQQGLGLRRGHEWVMDFG